MQPSRHPFFSRHRTVAGQGPQQMRTIEFHHLVLRLCEHQQLVLGQFVEVIEHVHEQERRGEFLREARLDPTVELAITQRKHPMSLVVVDQGTVVELRGSQSERVIGGWRKDQKILVAQEGLDQFVIVRRHAAESRLTRCVVQALRQLLQLSARDQFAQMAIYRVRDPSQIFASVHPARAQSAGKVGRPPLRGGWMMTQARWQDDFSLRIHANDSIKLLSKVRYVGSSTNQLRIERCRAISIAAPASVKVESSHGILTRLLAFCLGTVGFVASETALAWQARLD